MDSTVIQEIANQLGIAVDQAGQFIAEQLPTYAGLKAMQATVPIVILSVITLILLIVALVPLILIFRDKNGKTDMDSSTMDALLLTFAISGVIALVFLFVTVLFLAFGIPEIIGWSNYPEAMLIDMALKAVG